MLRHMSSAILHPRVCLLAAPANGVTQTPQEADARLNQARSTMRHVAMLMALLAVLLAVSAPGGINAGRASQGGAPN